MKFLKYISAFSLLFLLNCDVSMLSSEELNEMSNIFVSVKIDDNGEKPELNHIKVKLTDGKKQIINEDISILVNKKPLQLVVINELYYTKSSFYFTDSLLRSESYYFEIILPDSSRHPLAFIAPKDVSLCSFEQIEATSNKNDLQINWQILHYLPSLLFGKE